MFPKQKNVHTRQHRTRIHGFHAQSLRLTLFILHKPQVSRKNAMQNKLSFPTCNLLLSTLFLYSFLSTRLLGAYGSSLKVQLEILSLSPIYSQHTVFKGPCISPLLILFCLNPKKVAHICSCVFFCFWWRWREHRITKRSRHKPSAQSNILPEIVEIHVFI